MDAEVKNAWSFTSILNRLYGVVPEHYGNFTVAYENIAKLPSKIRCII
jgi:hypothetical protein